MHGNRYIPMTYFDSLADARKKLRENSILALELQAELAEWLGQSSSVPVYQHFVKSYGHRKLVSEADMQTRGVMLHKEVKRLIGLAPTYYVTPDMCEMVKMAAEEMPSEGLSPTIIPSERGFLVFSKPVGIDGPPNDPNDPSSTEFVKVTAVMWEQTQVRDAEGNFVPGITYYLFSHPHDSAVSMNHMAAKDIERAIGLVVEEPIIEDEPEWFVTPDELRRTFGPLNIYDFSGWAYGRSWNSVPYADPQGIDDADGTIGGAVGVLIEGVQQVHPIVDQVRRHLLATWLMLSQTVTTLQSETPPRYLRRRAQRFMPENGDIVIVRLRKEVKEGPSNTEYDPEDEDVPWYNHRFLVRGHWKRQRFGPGGSDRKLIWVSPYIKGPEDAPLVVKDKIYSLEA